MSLALFTRYGLPAGAVAPPEPFSPDDLANLALWLDASDSGTVTLNGSDVSAWADKSGNGRNMSQGSAALQPAYVTNAHNGLATLRFTGSEYLGIASDDLFRTVAAVTVYAVLLVSVNDHIAIALWGGTGIGTSVRLSVGAEGDEPKYRVQYRRLNGDNPERYQTGNILTTGTLRLLSVHHDWQNQVGHIYLDGASMTAAALTTTAGVTSSTAGDVRVGNVGNLANNNGWRGDICEVLVYRAFHSDTDRQKVEAYVAAKWGITL